MGKLTEMLSQLQTIAGNAGQDAVKADEGNRAAVTRLRKAMQEVKTKAQAIRAQAIREASLGK